MKIRVFMSPNRFGPTMGKERTESWGLLAYLAILAASSWIMVSKSSRKEKEPMIPKSSREPMGSESSPTEPAFIILCQGGERVRVNVKCVYESEVLYLRLKDIDDRRKMDDPDPRFDMDERDIGHVRKILGPKHIVSMVNDYCVERFKIVETHDDGVDLLSEKLREFDSEFLRGKPIFILFHLLNVAIQLQIKSLMCLVRNAILDRHDGSIESLLFSVCKTKDFKKFYVQNTWALHGVTGVPRAKEQKPPKPENA